METTLDYDYLTTGGNSGHNCKGFCSRNGGRRGLGANRSYFNWSYCRKCEFYFENIKLTSSKCMCCGYKLRTRPHDMNQSAYSRRLKEMKI